MQDQEEDFGSPLRGKMNEMFEQHFVTANSFQQKVLICFFAKLATSQNFRSQSTRLLFRESPPLRPR